MIQFNPIEHTYVAPIDLESFSKSMDRLETGHKAALEGQSNLLTTFYNMGFNKEEFQQGPNGEPSWVDQKVSQIKQQIDEASMYGNYASSQDVVTRLTQDIATDPSVNGRLWSNKAHTEFEENVDKMVDKGNLPKVMGDWIKERNQYSYSDERNADGNIVMGKIWEPSLQPVEHVEWDDVLSNAIKMVSPDSGVFRGNNAENTFGDMTNLMIVRNGSIYTQDAYGTYQELSEDKIQQIVQYAIDNDEKINASLYQDYTFWMDKASEEFVNVLEQHPEIVNDNGSINYNSEAWKNLYASSEYIRHLYDDDGSILNYNGYIRRRINQYAHIARARAIVNTNPSSMENRLATYSKSASTSKKSKNEDSDVGDENGSEANGTGGNNKGNGSSTGSSKTRKTIGSTEGRFGGRKRFAMGGEENDEEDNTETNTTTNTNNNVGYRPNSVVGTKEEDGFLYSPKSGLFYQNNLNIRNAENSIYMSLGDRLTGTQLEGYDVKSILDKYNGNSNSFLNAVKGVYNLNNQNDSIDYCRLANALSYYNHCDSMFQEYIKRAGSNDAVEAFAFMRDFNTGYFNGPSKASTAINQLTSHLMSGGMGWDAINKKVDRFNSNTITITLGKYLYDDITTNRYKESSLSGVDPNFREVKNNDGSYTITFTPDNQYLMPIFAMNLKNSHDIVKQKQPMRSRAWEWIRHWAGAYGMPEAKGDFMAGVNDYSYAINQVCNHDQHYEGPTKHPFTMADTDRGYPLIGRERMIVPQNFSYSAATSILTNYLLFKGAKGVSGKLASRLPDTGWGKFARWFLQGSTNAESTGASGWTKFLMFSPIGIGLEGLSTGKDIGRWGADSRSENANDAFMALADLVSDNYNKSTKLIEDQHDDESGSLIKSTVINAHTLPEIKIKQAGENVTEENRQLGAMEEDLILSLKNQLYLRSLPEIGIIDDNDRYERADDIGFITSLISNMAASGLLKMDNLQPVTNFFGSDGNNNPGGGGHVVDFFVPSEKTIRDWYESKDNGIGNDDYLTSGLRLMDKRMRVVLCGLYDNDNYYNVSATDTRGMIDYNFNVAKANNSNNIKVEGYMGGLGINTDITRVTDNSGKTKYQIDFFGTPLYIDKEDDAKRWADLIMYMNQTFYFTTLLHDTKRAFSDEQIERNIDYLLNGDENNLTGFLDFSYNDTERVNGEERVIWRVQPDEIENRLRKQLQYMIWMYDNQENIPPNMTISTGPRR